MKNNFRLAAAVFLAGLATPSAAVLAPALDQEFIAANENIGPTPWNSGNPVDWSQTFTAGLDGILHSIEVKISRYTTTTLPLLVDIRTLAGNGAPTEDNAGPNVLASVAVEASAIPTSFDFLTVDFSAASIQVAAGDRLAIVFRSNVSDADYELRGQNTGGYDGGGLYLRWSSTGNVWGKHPSLSNADIVFRTYVTAVPEPRIYAMLLAGLGCVAWLTRRRNRDA